MDGVFAAQPAKLIDCSAQYSFYFDLIQGSWSGANPATLHRICTLMRKMKVQSFLQEDLEQFPELADECAAASTRCGGEVRATATRFTFLRCTAATHWQHVADDDVLGYAVLVTLNLPDGSARTYVLEAALRVPTIFPPDSKGKLHPVILPNYYVHCCRIFRTTVGTGGHHWQFDFPATFFCQQNDLTHVCAHAALRTAINSSPLYTGNKLLNEDINRVLGIHHLPKSRVGHYDKEEASQPRGLNLAQIQAVVRSFGFEVHAADFNQNPATDYVDFIYPLVESGCPVILGLSRPSVAHVVAVLGHTANSDRATPEARANYGGLPFSRYLSSSAWADHFIIADDNLGMYVTQPTDSIRNIVLPRYNHELHASIAAGIVPKGVSLPGHLAESVAVRYATRLIEETEPEGENRWLHALKRHLSKNQLVCRSLLQTKKDYLSVMSTASDGRDHRLGPTEMDLLATSLPEWIWITELSIPNLLCGNKNKLGDVISRANATQQEHEQGQAVIFAWLPGLVWTDVGLANGPFQWPIQGHIPLLRGAGSGKPELEW